MHTAYIVAVHFSILHIFTGTQPNVRLHMQVLRFDWAMWDVGRCGTCGNTTRDRRCCRLFFYERLRMPSQESHPDLTPTPAALHSVCSGWVSPPPEMGVFSVNLRM